MFLQDAYAAAQRFLDVTLRSQHAEEVVINRCEEKPEAWSFSYNARAFLESGNISAALAGNGPVIVPKGGSAPYFGPVFPDVGDPAGEHRDATGNASSRFEEELDVLTTRILVPLRGDKTLDSTSLAALRELVRSAKSDGVFDDQIHVRLAHKLWLVFTLMLAEADHARDPEPILAEAWRYEETLNRAFRT